MKVVLELKLKLFWLGVYFSQTFVDEELYGLVLNDSDRFCIKTWIVKSVQDRVYALPNFIFESEAACNVVLGMLVEPLLDGAIDEMNVIQRLFFFLLLFFLLLLI